VGTLGKASSPAAVYVFKIEAARRQIDAAIRMTFLNEDDLAIHTVASAAYKILRDLLIKRGENDVERHLKHRMFEIARRLAHAEMSADEYKKFSAIPKIFSIAQEIEERGEKFTADHIADVVGKEQKKALVNALSKTANFLKHADRDYSSSIALNDVDNKMIIMRASAAYIMLMNSMTPEMCVFHIFSSLEDSSLIVPDSCSGIVQSLKRVSSSQRHRACLRLIQKWDSKFSYLAS
jgi:hypothetical protein